MSECDGRGGSLSAVLIVSTHEDYNTLDAPFLGAPVMRIGYGQAIPFCLEAIMGRGIPLPGVIGTKWLQLRVEGLDRYVQSTCERTLTTWLD